MPCPYISLDFYDRFLYIRFLKNVSQGNLFFTVNIHADRNHQILSTSHCLIIITVLVTNLPTCVPSITKIIIIKMFAQ